VFQSDRDGDSELFVQGLDGSDLRKLVARPEADEYNASWNPDGTRLVFQSQLSDGSDSDLYLVDADGGGLAPLMVGPTFDRAPAFCDLDTVVFQRNVGDVGDLFAIETDGTGLRQLTDHPANDSTPACSPDGTKVAFISTRDDVFGLYEVPLDSAVIVEEGSIAAVATPSLLVANALDPEYSPSGRELAFVGPDPEDRNAEIFTKDLVTGDVIQRTFTDPPIANRLPKYLPDQRIRSLQASTSEPVGQAALAIVAPGRDAVAPGGQVADEPDESAGSTLLYTVDTDGTDAGRSVASTADELPPIEPGSAAVVQPLIGDTCECDFLAVRVRDVRLRYTERTNRTVQAQLRFRVDWFLGCTQGVSGRCSASLDISANRGFGGLGEQVTCEGECELGADGDSSTDGEIGVLMERGPGPDLANRVVAIDLRTTCDGRSALIRYNVSIGKSGRIRNVTRARVGE
jgi:dipeptidyl aminopeptidase/acylaminoacyl peptidase